MNGPPSPRGRRRAGLVGRKDEARVAYETGIRQAEKFGHGGMAEDLRVAIIQLGEQD